jgi:hypothetical protein
MKRRTPIPHKPEPSATPPALTLEDLVLSYEGKAFSPDELAHMIQLGLKVIRTDSPDEIANDLHGLAQLCLSLDQEAAFTACDWRAAHLIGKLLDQLAVRVNRALQPNDLTVTVKDGRVAA